MRAFCPSVSGPPAADRRPSVPARPSSWTSPTCWPEGFPKDAPVLQHQRSTKSSCDTPDHTARPTSSGRLATGWSSQFWPPAGAHPAQKRPRRRHRVPNHHFLPHASYEAFWSIFCYCSPTAQLLQSSSSVTDETNPSVAGRSPKFCPSLRGPPCRVAACACPDAPSASVMICL